MTRPGDVSYAPGIPGYWVYRNLRHFSGYNVTAF